MTLVVCWVRTRSDGQEELFCASDSRISSAGSIDSALKIFPLPRNDSVIAFAGETYFGYPLAVQLVQAVYAHSPLLVRELDYQQLREHALSVFNAILSTYRPEAAAVEHPDTKFLLAGYSWKQKSFEVDVFEYSKGERRFHYRSAFRGIGRFGKIMHTGDWANRSRSELIRRLRTRFGQDSIESQSTCKARFDMEPFEVLRDALRGSSRLDSIGGAPQIVKVTAYMECRPIAVYWPDKKSGQVFLGGRKLLEYENVDNWILDPDTFQISHPRFTGDSQAPVTQ
jgi:hypothetical protein